MSINISKQSDTPSFLKNTSAAAAGGVLGNLPTTAALGVTMPLITNKMIKLNRSISKDEVQLLNTAAQSIIETSGLAQKGLEVIKSPKIDFSTKLFMKMADKIPSKKIAKFIKSMHPIVQFKLGRNACFVLNRNMVICSDKIALSKFHELGHAMNFHGIGGKLGNILGKMRIDVAQLAYINKAFFPAMAIVAALSFITTTALFKHKKAEGEKPKGFWDKTTTFIKNNVGKLTTLCLLPLPAEEAIASLKGEQALKQLGTIPVKLMKKVKLSNRLGLLTYVTIATLAGVGMMLSVKIKDKIAQPNVK